MLLNFIEAVLKINILDYIKILQKLMLPWIHKNYTVMQLSRVCLFRTLHLLLEPKQPKTLMNDLLLCGTKRSFGPSAYLIWILGIIGRGAKLKICLMIMLTIIFNALRHLLCVDFDELLEKNVIRANRSFRRRIPQASRKWINYGNRHGKFI